MKLKEEKGTYHITHKKEFIPHPISTDTVIKCFDFAYSMVFGSGHHRNHRSGGQARRKNGELFANTFQGKLAEFSVYQLFTENDITDLDAPDLEIYGEGIWDDTDLNVLDHKVSIKSASFFSNLLLLESKDWNSNAEYIPNLESTSSQTYDYFILVRIKPDVKKMMQTKNFLYEDMIDKEILKTLVDAQVWSYDVAGVASLKTIKHIINNEYLLPQNSLLNGKIKMDADNYYIQSGSLKAINELIAILKQS